MKTKVNRAMSVRRFWGLMDDGRKRSEGDTRRQVEILTEELAESPANEIVGFDERLERLIRPTPVPSSRSFSSPFFLRR
jgi:hypothetical protein